MRLNVKQNLLTSMSLSATIKLETSNSLNWKPVIRLTKVSKRKMLPKNKTELQLMDKS